MKVKYVDHLGTDLTVCNAARVSFDKKSDWGYKCVNAHDRCGGSLCEYCERALEHADEKLIKYLASHGHWTPFAHPQVQLHVKAPIFVARQLVKHQVGMVWNEISRRYVDSEPEFYKPEVWRARPEGNIKQGSSHLGIFNQDDPEVVNYQKILVGVYNHLIDCNVAPEQARMVLPQSVYTEWYWTGSLAAWARVYKLRSAEDAQKETQEIAKQIGVIIKGLFPVSWEALNGTD